MSVTERLIDWGALATRHSRRSIGSVCSRSRCLVAARRICAYTTHLGPTSRPSRSNCSGNAAVSGATVTISGVSLAPGASCEVRVSVATQAPGSFRLTTGVTTSDQTGAGTDRASATLSVRAAAPATTTTTTSTAGAVFSGGDATPPAPVDASGRIGPGPRRAAVTGQPTLALVALALLLIDAGALVRIRAARR